MRVLCIIMLLLAGCTSDRYAANVPQEKMQADLQVCHKQVFEHFNAVVHRDPTGAVIGGVLGGAIGGGLVGIAASSVDQKPDIDKGIQECMEKRGYKGSSHGYN